MATKALDGPVGNTLVRTYTGPAYMTYGLGVTKGATDGSVVAVTASGMKCIGITESTDLVGSTTIGVIKLGETLAIAGAAVPADTECIIDATGRVIASTAQGDYVIGRTVTSAAAAGVEVVFMVQPYIR